MSLFIFFKYFFLKHRLNNPASKIVFDHYFFDLKYYLHPAASNEGFSNLLNISNEQLEQISNDHYGSPFQILLNEYRYQHFMRELESPINSNLSIESIMKLSGFESNDKFVEFLKTKEGIALFDTELLSK